MIEQNTHRNRNTYKSAYINKHTQIQKQKQHTVWKGGTGGEENPQVCLPVWVRRVTGVWGAEGTEQGSLSPPRKKQAHTSLERRKDHSSSGHDNGMIES